MIASLNRSLLLEDDRKFTLYITNPALNEGFAKANLPFVAVNTAPRGYF
jgi:hypothetical protein